MRSCFFGPSGSFFVPLPAVVASCLVFWLSSALWLVGVLGRQRDTKADPQPQEYSYPRELPSTPAYRSILAAQLDLWDREGRASLYFSTPLGALPRRIISSLVAIVHASAPPFALDPSLACFISHLLVL